MKSKLNLITLVGLLTIAGLILAAIYTNRSLHSETLTSILSNIVSGLIGFLGGGVVTAHAQQDNVRGDKVTIEAKEEKE